MASAADVRDIMGLPAQETAITKDSIINADKKKKEKKKDSGVFQRPEGMHRFGPPCQYITDSVMILTLKIAFDTLFYFRELYNLLYSENKELPCPLIQVFGIEFSQILLQFEASMGPKFVNQDFFLRQIPTSTKDTNRCELNLG